MAIIDIKCEECGSMQEMLFNGARIDPKEKAAQITCNSCGVCGMIVSYETLHTVIGQGFKPGYYQLRQKTYCNTERELKAEADKQGIGLWKT